MHRVPRAYLMTGAVEHAHTESTRAIRFEFAALLYSSATVVSRVVEMESVELVWVFRRGQQIVGCRLTVAVEDLVCSIVAGSGLAQVRLLRLISRLESPLALKGMYLGHRLR
jgi:hypothetical protein